MNTTTDKPHTCMNKIDINKKYRTREGYEVRIYAVDGGGDYPVHGAIRTGDKWESKSWKSDGTYIGILPYRSEPDCFDLIEVRPYDHIKIDDKVWVSDTENYRKYKGYFAGVEVGGNPLIFADGRTSWTTDGRTEKWGHCELVE